MPASSSQTKKCVARSEGKLLKGTLELYDFCYHAATATAATLYTAVRFFCLNPCFPASYFKTQKRVADNEGEALRGTPQHYAVMLLLLLLLLLTLLLVLLLLLLLTATVTAVLTVLLLLLLMTLLLVLLLLLLLLTATATATAAATHDAIACTTTAATTVRTSVYCCCCHHHYLS